MPLTAAYLASCRSAISSLPELTTLRTAYALYDAAARADKARYWNLAFSDAQIGGSPAMALKRAIRETVTALASTTGGISDLEREEAYRTMVGEYVPEPDRPMTNDEEKAALQELLLQEQLS